MALPTSEKIFAHVHNPLGFEFWGGGVLVTSGPDLLFLKDTEWGRQGRRSLPDPARLGHVGHAPCGEQFDLRSRWWNLLAEWYFLGSQPRNTVEAEPEYRRIGHVPIRSADVCDYADRGQQTRTRTAPALTAGGTCTPTMERAESRTRFGPREMVSKCIPCWPQSFVRCRQTRFLSSAHFPEDMQQDFLILNVIGFLGVKQYDLNRGDGGKREYGHVLGTPQQALLNGEDRNFRPSDAIVGEDGALYVADWHNMIIGHMQHNIRDPSRDHKHGRILRLTAQGRPLQEPVAIHGQPIEMLLENLKHPVDGVRQRTRVELSARDSDAMIAAAQAWAKDFDPNDETEAHHLLEALWLHQQHDVTSIWNC